MRRGFAPHMDTLQTYAHHLMTYKVVCETVSFYPCTGETYIHRHNRWCPTRHHSVYDWLPGLTGLCCPDQPPLPCVPLSCPVPGKHIVFRMSIPPRNNFIIFRKMEFGNGFSVFFCVSLLFVGGYDKMWAGTERVMFGAGAKAGGLHLFAAGV